MMRNNRRCGRLCRSCGTVMLAGITLLPLAGCFDWSQLAGRKGDSGGPETAAVDAGSEGTVTVTDLDGAEAEMVEVDIGAAGGETGRFDDADPFSYVELEEGQAPFLNAARPFLLAMSKRDYVAAFGHLSSTAKQKFSRNQFIPTADEQVYAQNDAAPIVNPTVEQFVQLMQDAESFYGTPTRLDTPMVETDPEILERRDPLLAAFELGAMPDSIPVEHRRAAVQAWVYCHLTDAQIKQAADDEGIDEAEYRRLMSEAEDGGEGAYFKLKTVVIDEGSGPVIGYFEIAPPSMLD